MNFSRILAAARTVPGPAPGPVEAWASGHVPSTVPSTRLPRFSLPSGCRWPRGVCPPHVLLGGCRPPLQISEPAGDIWNQHRVAHGHLPPGRPAAPRPALLHHVPQHFSSSFHFLLIYALIPCKLWASFLNSLYPFCTCFFQGMLPQFELVTVEVSVSAVYTVPHSFDQIMAQTPLSVSLYCSPWLNLKKKTNKQRNKHKTTNKTLMFYFGLVPSGDGREPRAALLGAAHRAPPVLRHLRAAVRAPRLKTTTDLPKSVTRVPSKPGADQCTLHPFHSSVTW